MIAIDAGLPLLARLTAPDAPWTLVSFVSDEELSARFDRIINWRADALEPQPDGALA